MTTDKASLVADLKTIDHFHDLDPSELEWLAEHIEEITYRAGEVVARAGSLAQWMAIIFEGELNARRPGSRGQEGTLYIARAGLVTGKLPFSRMKEYPADIRAVTPTRLGRLDEKYFNEMLTRIPLLAERLVGVLSDRVRETARVDQNREKLAALGKLSAGLAHELNNPASAARRSVSALRDALKRLADINRRLAARSLTEQQRCQLAEFEAEAATRLDVLPAMDSLAQSDREEELGDWLEEHGVKKAWELVPALAEAGIDRPCLDEILEMVGADLIGDAIERTTATFIVERLLRDIEHSTDRISELVGAVKEYSYMDRVKEQEIDIHRGLDATLTMLHHTLKGGIKVIKEYDKGLPKIMANGGELNQIWTNLIDNAINAMKGQGELRIRTSRVDSMVLVEIIDNGPGIPPEIQSRIFEPFFTTKDVGHGSGLGLDLVYRIVQRHHGDIRFQSRPGETRFEVRLPVNQPRSEEPDEVHAHESNP
jgi:signal transduction histidine kinase